MRPPVPQSQPSSPPAAGSGSGIAATVPLHLPATFSFSCYETPFDAVVVRGPGDGARLTVRGQLGILPYSAECATTRRYMHAVVDAGKELPFAEISLTSTQSIVVRGSMDFTSTPTPASVAAGASVIAVAMKPVIELVAACRMMARHRAAPA